MTPSIRSQYNIDRNRGLFEGNNLVLPIAMDDYKAPSIDRSLIQIGYGSNFVEEEFDLFEFEATCKDGREAIEHILQDIIDNSRIDKCNIQPITCYDYHKLTNSKARVDGYTTREGLLKIEPISGTILLPDWGRVTKGYRLIFTQNREITE